VRWQWIPPSGATFVTLVTDEASFEAFFDAMLTDHAQGRRVVFHITDLATGRTAGSMSYGNLFRAGRPP